MNHFAECIFNEFKEIAFNSAISLNISKLKFFNLNFLIFHNLIIFYNLVIVSFLFVSKFVQ